MKSILFAFCCFISINVWAHPLHVSICEVEYDGEDQALEIVLRMFIDEMESAVLEEHGQRLSLGEVNQLLQADSLIQLYLKKHFSISINSQENELEYLGNETENTDRIVCYMTITDIEKIETITFFNELFQELFDDQINMVHLEVGEKKQSTFFTNKKREEVISF